MLPGWPESLPPPALPSVRPASLSSPHNRAARGPSPPTSRQLPHPRSRTPTPLAGISPSVPHQSSRSSLDQFGVLFKLVCWKAHSDSFLSKEMVGPCGLEPQTSSVSRTRSNQLSYGPKSFLV